MSFVSASAITSPVSLRASGSLLFGLVLDTRYFEILNLLEHLHSITKGCQLTDPAPLDLDPLEILHRSPSFLYRVILHKPIGRFERNLGKPSESMKQIKDVTLRYLVAREVACREYVSAVFGRARRGSCTNKDARAFRKAIPLGLRHVLSLISQELIPLALVFGILSSISSIGGRLRRVWRGIHGSYGNRRVETRARRSCKTAQCIRGRGRRPSSHVRGRLTGGRRCGHTGGDTGIDAPWVVLRGIRLGRGLRLGGPRRKRGG